MFTFLSVIRQNFKYNLRLLSHFRVNTQKSTDFAYAFSKNYRFILDFLKKDYIFYTKNLFFYDKRCPNFRKNHFFSNLFTFLSIIRQNFQYNLKILANFRVKTKKSTDFAYNFSKNYSFWGDFLIKIMSLYTKNLFFTTKDAQNFVKISGLVTCLHF